MNIIKFKDAFKEGDDKFNASFRGKYCYAVKWTVAVPVGAISEREYIAACKSKTEEDDYDYDFEFINIDDYSGQIDNTVTNKINSVTDYTYYNAHVSEDFTIDQLKRFRTAVAESMLSAKSLWDDEYDPSLADAIESMLSYYANGMWDCALKSLVMMSSFQPVSVTTSSACCQPDGVVNFSSSVINANTRTSSCDCGCQYDSEAELMAEKGFCMSSYRKNIYNLMVRVFSDIAWWKLIDRTVAGDTAKMIDAILAAGLKVNTGSSEPIFGDCGCSDVTIYSSQVLENASKALKMIESGDTAKNSNFIRSSLYEWASKLYEKMEWK